MSAYHEDLLDFAKDIKAAIERYNSASVSTANRDTRRFSDDPTAREAYGVDNEIGAEAFEAADNAFKVARAKLKEIGIEIDDIEL